MAKRSDEWTPYGLEAIRQAHLRRRRLLGALAALGVLLLGGLLIETTTTSRTSISANGREVTDSISIPEPDIPEQQDHVTVSLEPGRVSRVESGNAPQDAQAQQMSVPPAVRASPYPWKLWALQALPWLLAGLAAWLLAAKRGKHDEINYGVYKGALPLEMLTAHHEKAVFTTRWATSSVFGKRRTDYLPPQMAEAPDEEA